MKQLMYSIFGFGATSRKAVLGKKMSIDIKEVAYIQESTARISALLNLYNRYRGTAYESRIKQVYEKTKEIHTYLVSRSRAHELEIFHLQNTDHFISAFTVIMDAYQQKIDPSFKPARFEPKESAAFALADPEKLVKRERPPNQVEMIRYPTGKGAEFYQDETKFQVPRLSIPEITINTFIKIPYRLVEGTNNFGAEIGYTSTPVEKENFLRYIAVQLGISNITYVGNALVNIPNSNGASPTGMVPIIHWEGCMYALNLNDYRLFPVKIHRRNS